MTAESNAGAIVRQDFSGEQLQRQAETAATAIAAAEKAAIEARHILAKKFPRDWDNVRARLEKECRRAGFADAAIYRKPVGKKKNEETGRWEQSYVEGLSVRFAEAAIRHVSNFYASSKSIYDDAEKAIIRVTVMDLETNATIETDVTVAKTVERRELKKWQKPLGARLNSYGDTVYIVPATDDEILNKTNALVSKALRNGVLRLLPGDIQDACEEICRKTQADRDKKDPDEAKRKLFSAFASLGIMPDALKAFLGTNAETLQPAELTTLRAIYAAIRDGETTWDAVMSSKEPEVTKDGEQKPSDQVAAATSSKVQELVNKHKAKTAVKNGDRTQERAAPESGQAPGERIDEHGEVHRMEPGEDDEP